MTILWSVGIASIVPAAQAADVALHAGDLIKASNASAVYYYSGTIRAPFFNSAQFNTWYTSFSGVKTISATQMGNIPLGAAATVRPGTVLVKIDSDPKTYAVGTGGVLSHIDSEARAVKLWGTMWYKNVIDVPDFLFSNYKSGSAITSDMYPDGSVVKYAGSSNIYYVEGGKSVCSLLKPLWPLTACNQSS